MTKPGILNDESDDLTQEELEEICREVEEEFQRNGIPSDAELMAEIEKLNASAPAKKADLGDQFAAALGQARRGHAKPSKQTCRIEAEGSRTRYCERS